MPSALCVFENFNTPTGTMAWTLIEIQSMSGVRLLSFFTMSRFESNQDYIGKG